MWRLVVFVGVLLWVLTIGASGAMNAVAGYALGRSEVEGYIFAALGIVADGWKALGPIVIASLLRDRKWIVSAAAALVWGACFVVAVSAAIGLAAQNRTAIAGGREAINAAYGAVSRDLDELRARSGSAPPLRSSSEVEAAVAAVFARPVPGAGTVATVSATCVMDSARTRSACAEIARLRVELSEAVETERVQHRRLELEREQQRLLRLGGAGGTDPQAQLLVRLLHGAIQFEDIGLGLVLMLVAMIELVSGFAPLVLTEFARTEKSRATGTAKKFDGRSGKPIELRPVGEVFEYMADCIRPAPRATIPIAMLVRSYQEWCESRGRTPLAQADFAKEFDRICREELQDRVRREGSDVRGITLIRSTAMISGEVSRG